MTQIPPTTPVKKWTFETAIEQLEFCDYEAIGGKLIWNDAFIWLKNCALAEKEEQVAALKEEGQEGARINNHNVEVLSQQIAALTAENQGLLEELEDKSRCYGCGTRIGREA